VATNKEPLLARRRDGEAAGQTSRGITSDSWHAGESVRRPDRQ